MCEPFTIAAALAGVALAAGAAQQGLQYYQQGQAAKAADKYNKTLAINAQKGYAQNAEQTANIVAEKQAAAAADISQSAIERRKAAGIARVSAAESGVSGISVDALLADYQRTEAVHKDAVIQNLEAETKQAEANLQAAGLNSANTVLTGSKQAQQPSIAGAVIGFSGSAAQTGFNFQAAKGAS